MEKFTLPLNPAAGLIVTPSVPPVFGMMGKAEDAVDNVNFGVDTLKLWVTEAAAA